MMLLQAHERKSKKGGGRNSDSDSDDSDEAAVATKNDPTTAFGLDSRGQSFCYEIVIACFVCACVYINK